MHILDNIARISAPPPDVLREEYILKQKPVIITDLFDGQPIRSISTEAEARGRLGHLKLTIQEEYTAKFLKALRGAAPSQPPEIKESASLVEYLDFVRANPETRMLCTEQTTPPEIMELFEPPEYSREDRLSLFFIANAGNVAHLHFDSDQRQVLLYQVFGRKRIILMEPKASKKLNPIRNISSFFVENLPPQEKEAFLRYMGAYECIVEPGETLFIPALFWHHLEYIDTAMSVGIRFGRNKYNRYLSKHFHPNMFLQNIAAKMIDEEVVEREYLDVFNEIEEANRRTFPNGLLKYKYMQTVFEDIYGRVCDDGVRGLYAFTNFEPLTDRVAQIDLALGLYKT